MRCPVCNSTDETITAEGWRCSGCGGVPPPMMTPEKTARLREDGRKLRQAIEKRTAAMTRGPFGPLCPHGNTLKAHCCKCAECPPPTPKQRSLTREESAEYAKTMETVLAPPFPCPSCEAKDKEIAGLKEVWLPCDQTVQCAVCLWVDWDDEPHPVTCPVGRLSARLAKAEEALRKAVEIESDWHARGGWARPLDECDTCNVILAALAPEEGR